MIDVENDELEALNTWNCAMLLKRKSRALLCKCFCKWKQISNDISNVKPTESSISSRSQTRSKTHKDALKQQNYTNQALQEELDTLIEEQRKLEEATSKIKKSLKDIPPPSQSHYRSQYSSGMTGSTRYSQTGRLNYI